MQRPLWPALELLLVFFGLVSSSPFLTRFVWFQVAATGEKASASLSAALPSVSSSLGLPKIEGLDHGKVEAILGDIKGKLSPAQLDELTVSLKSIGTADFKMPEIPGVDLKGLEGAVKDLKLPQISADLKASLPSVDLKVGSHSLSLFC